jgi:hypothetical protein
VPRLVLAVGVIIWALFSVLLGRRRRPPQPVRLSPTSDDPVADALADAQPVPRFADEELDLDANDLRWIVSVEELELVDEGGCNTVVGLDDMVWSYADVAAHGLADALADQPGIDAVHHMDREIVLVRSVLSLPDVHAATIRALLAINRNPRVPRYRSLRPAVMSAVADGLVTIMADHGFVGRLGMSLEHDESHIDPDDLHGPGFYRVFAEDRLVQVVGLRDGVGYHNDDGTIVNAHLRLTVHVVEIATTEPSESIKLERGCEVVAGVRILSTSYHGVPGTVDGIEHVLLGKALPLCESTTSRVAIVNRWVHGLPWHVPDRPRWEAADVAGRWGFRKHARDLLKHGRRRMPQPATARGRSPHPDTGRGRRPPR